MMEQHAGQASRMLLNWMNGVALYSIIFIVDIPGVLGQQIITYRKGCTLKNV